VKSVVKSFKDGKGRDVHRAVVEIDGVPFYGPIMADPKLAEQHRQRAEKVLKQQQTPPAPTPRAT
jgi:putative ubiquitin-RnfH superfamily antitoxin RatB of RatAB toxin-antitoxin module